MSDSSTVLPDDLAFDEGGHATDVALSALADGQVDILAAKLHTHVDGCPACTARLGEAALLSAHVGDALFTWGRERPQTPAAGAAFVSRPEAALVSLPEAAERGVDALGLSSMPAARPPAAVRRPLPFLAIAAALVVAILCAGPTFADPGGAPRWYGWVRVPLTAAWKLAVIAARGAWHPSRLTSTLQWVASALVAVAAVVVAACLARGRSSQGESR